MGRPYILMLACSVLTQSFAASAAAPCLDTFQDVLRYSLAADLNPRLKVIEDLRKYNEAIQPRLSSFGKSELNHALLQQKFEGAMYELSHMVPQFPIRDFLEWTEKHPLTQKELDVMRIQRKTIGDVLHARAAHFENTFGKTLQIGPVLENAKKEVMSLIDKCGAFRHCYETGLNKYFHPLWSRTCLSSNPVARRAVVVGLGILASGMALNKVQQHQDLKDMPWEYLANSIVWAPPLTEIACRNAERAQDLIGKQIDLKNPTTSWGATRATLQGYYRSAPQSFINYMLVSPLNDITYMGFHTAFENMRGHKSDHSKDEMKLFTYLGWDAGFSVPLLVLVTDPLILTVMPGVESIARSLVDNKVFSQVVYNTTDIASRVKISQTKTAAFQWYEKTWIKKWTAPDTAVVAKPYVEPKKSSP